MKVEKTNFVCEDMRKIESYTRLSECVEMIKEYDPQPKNTNGSIRWFLYRWDDGKTGVRRLNRCRKCGALYLVQAYHLNNFHPTRIFSLKTGIGWKAKKKQRMLIKFIQVFNGK